MTREKKNTKVRAIPYGVHLLVDITAMLYLGFLPISYSCSCIRPPLNINLLCLFEQTIPLTSQQLVREA